MNLLGLVFSIMLILSFGFYTCFDKHQLSNRLRSTYRSHHVAHRKILNSFQSKVYRDCRGKATKKNKVSVPKQEDEDLIEKELAFKPTGYNRECSRLNLWPLLNENKEDQHLLYELVAKLIREFYSPIFPKSKGFEYRFLDSLIQTIKNAMVDSSPIALEKMHLQSSELQHFYYRILKGTKKWDLTKNEGIPPFLDYVKCSLTKEKICLCHADPDLLTVLFGPTTARRLYSEIHQKQKPPLNQNFVEMICSETRNFRTTQDLFTLLEYGFPKHSESKKVFTASDGASGVSLRKNISIQSKLSNKAG